MTTKVKLSRLAVEDISDILAYTLQRYGLAQATAYGDLIHKTIEAVARNPGIGHCRPDIPPLYRAVGVEKHVIVYCKKETTVFVARILHDNMNFKTRV